MRRMAVFLLGAFVFGVAIAAIKGQAAGARDAFGNLSAVWVVVPFLAGTRYRRIWQAVAIGTATTMVAFFGFYLAEAAILDLGTHSWQTRISLTLGSGHVYETWGLLSGAVYGALGGLWATRSRLIGPVAVGLAFLCEPLIVLFLVRANIWGGGGLFQYPWLWLGEVAVGVAMIALVFATRGGRAQPTA